ncbi:hypothetical protein JTB14_005106 [Gonioctena quinquepunctata]|nr:hypothetical protein JTB14_005106 [Gonioctena quinquepunctata]
MSGRVMHLLYVQMFLHFHLKLTVLFVVRKHVPPDYKKKEMKKPPQYRSLVILVLDRTQKVDKNVLRLARERNDDYGRAILLGVWWQCMIYEQLIPIPLFM